MAEEQALHLHERQDADDAFAAFGQQVVRPMVKELAVDLAPADAMEEARPRTVQHELVPALAVGVAECTNGRGRRVRCGLVNAHARARPKTSSTRPQRKSPSSW